MNKTHLATLTLVLTLGGQLAATTAQAGAIAAADRLGTLQAADRATEAGLLHRISSDDDDDDGAGRSIGGVGNPRLVFAFRDRRRDNRLCREPADLAHRAGGRGAGQ